MSSSAVSVFQIPVKMGSHKLNIDIESNSTVSSSQFIELVLKKCKLNSNEKLARTYSLFESVSGIEKLLKSSVNVTDIWKQWAEQSAHHSVQFIVRKCFKVEKKLNTSINCNDKRQQMIKKCYAKINSQPSEVKSKREYLKKIIHNEQEIKKQSEQLHQIEAMISKLNVTPIKNEEKQQVDPVKVKQIQPESKLCNYHHNNLVNNLNEKFSDNINFLQFLYYKLKKQNIAQQNKSFSYEKLIDNSCGNSSSGEDNYDYNSNRTSRNTSTSTLESLV